MTATVRWDLATSRTPDPAKVRCCPRCYHTVYKRAGPACYNCGHVEGQLVTLEDVKATQTGICEPGYVPKEQP